MEFVEVSRAGDVVTVVLNRPPVNAVSQAMYQEIHDVFAAMEETHPTAKVVVLRGAGRHFCAGNDLPEFLGMNETNVSRRMRLVRETFAAVYECPLPTIAAVHGSALGTGMVFAACCDIVVASEDARFGTPEVNVGVMGGGRHLARLAGEQLTRLMYFTADPVGAPELARAGRVICVPREELDARVARIAERIARHSAVILRHAKESLNRVEFMELRAGYEAEQRMTAALMSEPDSLEARRAAAERRPPRYRS
jgi:enoyl-CoA hydratase